MTEEDKSASTMSVVSQVIRFVSIRRGGLGQMGGENMQFFSLG